MDFPSFLRQLGANIRQARWIAGLTQEEVAAKGVTYRYYQELERGRRNPTARTLFTLARWLGTSVSALTETERRSGARGKHLSEIPASPPKRGRKARVPSVRSGARVSRSPTR